MTWKRYLLLGGSVTHFCLLLYVCSQLHLTSGRRVRVCVTLQTTESARHEELKRGCLDESAQNLARFCLSRAAKHYAPKEGSVNWCSCERQYDNCCAPVCCHHVTAKHVTITEGTFVLPAFSSTKGRCYTNFPFIYLVNNKMRRDFKLVKQRTAHVGGGRCN
jgi:hypothetical protein